MEQIKMPFVGKYPITQKYGVKVAYMRCGYHTGVDWGLPKGTPLIACFSGKVIKASKWQLTGYGREIQIQRKDGLVAQYAHCSEIFCELGTEIEEGTIIGKSGNSGYCISLTGGQGYHLHFGTQIDGKWFDPLSILEGYNLNIKIEVENKDEKVEEKNQEFSLYQVNKGDSFWKISKMVFGQGSRWREIWKLNKTEFPNPNKLSAGVKIKIPKL